MADTSLIIGNGNWAVKEDSLLGYNIIQGKYVPIEMNVSRATTATRVNSAGLIELVPRNLLTYSQQIDNTDWVKTNAPTITTNIALAPDGTTTADGIKADDAVNFKYISQTKTVAANSTVTSSVFVKKETSETNFGGFNIYFTGGTPKICYVIVNAVNGTATISNSTITPIVSVVDFGAYWRISATATDNGSNTLLQCAYYATLSTSGTNILQAVGSVRTVWGFQLEVAATATEYFPTTDRFDIPRIDYSTGTASLLVEPQRTNLVLYSEEFSNVNWEKGTPITLVSNTTETTSPQGINNATKATANGTGLIHIRQAVFGGTTSPTTNSIFVKKANNRYVGFRNGGSGVFHDVFDFDTETWTNNSTSTLSFDKLINGWYRLKSSRTNTLPNTYISVTIPPDTSGAESATVSNLTLYLWGGQSELNVLYPTSYIPTTTATVTRNADVISKTGVSSLIGQAEGTIFWDVKDLAGPISSGNLDFGIRNIGFTNSIAITTNTLAQPFRVQVKGTSVTLINYTSAITTAKACVKYGTFGVKLFLNGNPTPVATSPTNPNFSSVDLIDIKGTFMSYKTNSFALWTTALTDAQCISLTTP